MKKNYHIGIVGCGATGKDLFDYMSKFPFSVVWICHKEERARQQNAVYERQQNRMLKLGVIDKDAHRLRKQNTMITSDIKKLATCDLVIESITENKKKKQTLFQHLEAVVAKKCVLSSNTSSLVPDELFSGMKNPERCIGLHFFFPLSMQHFVEINVAKQTGERTVRKAKDFCETMGKKHLVLTGSNQFIINRMFLKMQAGCCRLNSEGVLGTQDIDNLIKEKLFPVGIFEFFDRVGMDVILPSVKNYMMYEPDPEFYRPMIEMLEQKLADGKPGKKAQAGFYAYPLKTSLSSGTVPLPQQEEVLRKITRWYLDGVYDALSRRISTKDDLEQIVREYTMTSKSPFQLAEEVGYIPNN